jgi:hypothetical protein
MGGLFVALGDLVGIPSMTDPVIKGMVPYL